MIRTLAVLVIFCANAGAAGRPRYGGMLRLSFAQAADSFEPAQAITLPEVTVSRAVFDTLTVIDGRGLAAESLAVSWNAESGGKRWIFNLRPGVRFHDGSALTAAVARASLEQAVSRAASGAASRLRDLQMLCASPAPLRLACDLAAPLALPLFVADPALAIFGDTGAGTGPFRVANFARLPRSEARLEAFDAHWRGRPYLDSVEMEFAVDSRRQRVDFELRRSDVLIAAATEPRLPEGVRSVAPHVLLLLGASAAPRARDALRLVQTEVDRDALARLLPADVARPAAGLLPGWFSGYEFLFTWSGARPTLGSGAPFRLIYYDGDPVARLVASRLVLEMRDSAVTLVVEALPKTVFEETRRSGKFHLILESLRLGAGQPSLALADLSLRAGGLAAIADAVSAEAQYRQERAALDSGRLAPLLHYRDRYVFQPALDQVRIGESGLLDLANSWRRAPERALAAPGSK